MIEDIKLSRRDFTKTIVVGTGALYMGLFKMPSSVIPSIDILAASDKSGVIKDTLVVLVDGDKVTGFKDMEQHFMKDSELIKELNNGGDSNSMRSGLDYGKEEPEEPSVLLIRKDGSIMYKGLEEFVLKDNVVIEKLSDRFKNIGG